MTFAFVVLVNFVLGMVMVVLEALELALLGMAGSHNEGSDARREGSYSFQICGICY